MNTETTRCPKCGAELAANSPEGLCPACLMKFGMATMPVESVSSAEGIRPVAALPEAGQTFGPYRIARLLGRGGMGAVYETEHLESGRRVALKVLSHQLDSPESRARFLREGRLAASINHPNSVYVYGTDEINGMPVIAMELVAGGTLQERVKRDGPLPAGKAVDAVLDLIGGLEAAQAIGILHRDIKPANCFEDADGTVKIGDFGLSISSEARGDTNLTQAGVFLGTPAFCSPEQLRGEELNVRSDMYSVGVTLFYLLTGRTPFEADNMVKLLATVLEKTPPSPKKYQPGIPRALANIVLRCLEKTAGDRFKNYAELRQALAPFSSTAPAPAPIGRRLLAGLLDGWFAALLMSLIGFTAMFVLKGHFGEPATGYGSLRDVFTNLTGFLVAILYYAIPEGLRGASLGKWICGVRVVGPDRNPPGIPRALARAAIYVLVPMVPIETALVLMGPGIISHTALLIVLGNLQWAIKGLLFCTIRQRNGLAAIHDLITKTRVIRKARHQERPALIEREAALEVSETKPKVGPYHVLETLEKTGECEWLLAYDTKLLRKIWLRVVPAGTPPVAPSWRTLGRVGRLRWITGRRTATENWDAFEGLSGKPLVGLLDQPHPWRHVRFWLLDLASEFSAAEKDGTLPDILTLDRVWITADGRAKLLDFRAPGAVASTVPATRDGKVFLNQVACVALGGRGDVDPDVNNIRVPMPVHARKFLESLPTLPNIETIAANIRPLLQNVAEVTRARRAAIVLGCIAVPVLISVLGVVSMRLIRGWMNQPDIREMSQIFGQRMASQIVWPKDKPRPTDDDAMIYIASHYRHAITNKAVWQSFGAQSMIPGANRIFVEDSIRKYPNPSADQIAKAAEAMKPYLENMKSQDVAEGFQSEFALLGGVSWIGIIGFFAVLAALLFRGGLVMLVCGVAVVRKDGRRASRGRIFWRSLIAWSPVLASPVLVAMITPVIAASHHPVAVQQNAPVPVVETVERDTNIAVVVTATATNPLAASNARATTAATNAYDSAKETGKVISSAMLPWAAAGMLFVLGLAIWSLSLRGRSLQDRLAGTTLVPR